MGSSDLTDSIEAGLKLIKYLGDKNRFNVYHSDKFKFIVIQL